MPAEKRHASRDPSLCWRYATREYYLPNYTSPRRRAHQLATGTSSFYSRFVRPPHDNYTARARRAITTRGHYDAARRRHAYIRHCHAGPRRQDAEASLIQNVAASHARSRLAATYDTSRLFICMPAHAAIITPFSLDEDDAAQQRQLLMRAPGPAADAAKKGAYFARPAWRRSCQHAARRRAIRRSAMLTIYRKQKGPLMPRQAIDARAPCHAYARL